MMKPKTIAYWTATAIVVFGLLPGGVMEVAHQRDAVAGIVQLGYPPYFVTILGIWKLLGAVALLVPGFPRLKEWAYAGAFFDFTGAAASLAACGDYGKFGFLFIAPLIFAIFAIASWALRPPTRRLDINRAL